ncbi:LytTR family DNA-binding domain-containing protein [Chitinophagaceae bacterium LB-8]|jgi:two-component system, LytTR family, response regulator|uniref:LytTR family DNA-binding domain-containing protein n=1 Tax=Paraflavisolibacter caeni TaxID=2982496 RepID=A0A9X3BA91_9BACT|nr:LytTR family DNA-binding domain-containing protein [Paraflavisolibacter caeni]MCU7552381.1 LytTR family DNA-binding domain-containing protein [Paraflavisolibacter caeni]
MTKIIIIEDEKYACDALVKTLYEAAADIEIKAILTSVEESIRFLSQDAEADLILSDVQLTDGLSFSIFNEVDIDAPIIFITGYDKFMMTAFEYNSIDYLLKPVSKDDLQKALTKYRKLQKHFMSANESLYHFINHFGEKKKTRILVRKGMEHVALQLDDIALFYTENKVVYVFDKCGKKYLADKNLSDLELQLDKDRFFRVNRQYIVNINFIRSFKAFERVKLQVELTLSDWHHHIIVSQETAPLFKKWLADA